MVFFKEFFKKVDLEKNQQTYETFPRGQRVKKTSLTNLNVIYLLIYGKCSKISNTFLFLFSNKLLVVRAEIHKKIGSGSALFV